MFGSSLCESRKAVLGPRAGGSPSMELTAPQRESGGTLTWRTPARSGLAPLTLPVWAVEPWFGIGFHCAHISSIYGVLLYPTLDGLARHAWLDPRTADRAKLINATCAQVTTFSRPTVRGVWTVGPGSWFPVPGLRQDGSGTPGQVLCSGMGGILSFDKATKQPCMAQTRFV